MKGYFLKATGGHLVPDDEPTIEHMRGIKTGEVISVEYKRPRNYKFHKKFFALMELVLQNQEKYTNMNSLLTEVKLQVGHYDEHITLGGKVVYQPKSISFASMDELEFNEFYGAVLDVVLKYFLTGMDKEELEYIVNQVSGFF